MDFVTLLRRDHERVSSLFTQIQSGFEQPDTPERHRLFRHLKRELDLHAAVEDLHVYRVFQQAEATRDAAREACFREIRSPFPLRSERISNERNPPIATDSSPSATELFETWAATIFAVKDKRSSVFAL